MREPIPPRIAPFGCREGGDQLPHRLLLCQWDGGSTQIRGPYDYLGLHNTEAYAPLHHQDQKHFLRLHIQTDGTVTLYPIGIERVGRKWTLCPDAPAHAPWFAPDGPEPAPRLIEQPIRIGRAGAYARARPHHPHAKPTGRVDAGVRSD